jgi:hypothetical protein
MKLLARKRRFYRIAALSAVSLLLLSGCSTSDGGMSEGPSTAAVVDSVGVNTTEAALAERLRDEAFSECSSPATLNLALINGQVFSKVEQLDVVTGDMVNVSVSSDVESVLKLPGSTSATAEISSGVTVICVQYLGAGLFYVELDDKVVANINVVDPAPADGIVE